MISVIIPAYNAEKTILSTIESVQKQTYQDLEIIVINDGSTDRTFEIVSNIRDSRIKIFNYPNGGISEARNRGISHANGEYISFLDADDVWTVEKLEKQLAALQNKPQASVAYSWVAVMLETSNNLEQIAFFSGKKVTFTGNIYSQLLLENFIGNGSNILVKKEAIAYVGKFDSSVNSCEDWDYYLRLAAKYQFILVPEHQILYRQTAGSTSTKGATMETKGLKVIEKAYQAAPQHLQKQKNSSIARFSIYCGQIYIDRSSDSQDIIKARQRLLKAIKLAPLSLFYKNTYILLLRILRKQLLPTQGLNSLITFFKQPFKMRQMKLFK
jgi:glycosyltransferase involved in cell wall biosynthesis